MRLSGVRLRVANPQELSAFYGTALGMQVQQDGANWRVGYPGQDADLVLCPGGGGYTHDRGQRYWKIGITVPNVDLAVDHLRSLGVQVGDPKQFLDIGYMAHLSDPQGFVIELLQHDFQGNRPLGAGNASAPFAAACIGQITLRSGDVQAEEAVFESLGMRLLSVQEVEPYGFDLHFYAFTGEHPPEPDLWSVANREWLWKRPYTTLEIQHIPDAAFVPSPDYLGLEVTGLKASQKDAFGDLIHIGT
jgi:catechol 2,3-dioxygenase-like lactoylglutathione lyase family enzyme